MLSHEKAEQSEKAQAQREAYDTMAVAEIATDEIGRLKAQIEEAQYHRRVLKEELERNTAEIVRLRQRISQCGDRLASAREEAEAWRERYLDLIQVTAELAQEYDL